MKNLSSITKKVGRGLTALALVGGLVGCGGNIKEPKKEDFEHRYNADVYLQSLGTQVTLRDVDKDGKIDGIVEVAHNPYFVSQGYEDKYPYSRFKKPMTSEISEKASQVLNDLKELDYTIARYKYDQIKGATH